MHEIAETSGYAPENECTEDQWVSFADAGSEIEWAEVAFAAFQALAGDALRVRYVR